MQNLFFRLRIFYKNLLRLALLFVLFQGLGSASELPFGYISYSTYNIGDDIQAVAAKRFLPSSALPINREYIGDFSHPTLVKTIVNGWFMHFQHNMHHHSDNPPPKKIWPPTSSIEPLFISIHFDGQFLPLAFSSEGIAYMKEHGPIGARDKDTLHQLRKRRIPSYFSGCLTLTLENHEKGRDNVLYAVDLDEECLTYLKSKTSLPIQVIHHEDKNLASLSLEERMHRAEEILSLYRKAKCVVTTRLHAAMPCLAFETPVLFILRNENDPRFFGLKELTRHCSRDAFLQGAFSFDFNHPSENSKDYVPIRDKLIRTVTKWVKS
jgi:hypothetical protein